MQMLDTVWWSGEATGGEKQAWKEEVYYTHGPQEGGHVVQHRATQGHSQLVLNFTGGE